MFDFAGWAAGGRARAPAPQLHAGAGEWAQAAGRVVQEERLLITTA